MGESCWCRMVVPETEILDEIGLPIHVIKSASIDKELAEYIVKMHNNNLKKNQLDWGADFR